MPLEPTKMRLRPTLSALIDLAVAQQESVQALPHLLVDDHEILTRPAEIAHRFVIFTRNPHGAEIAAAVQTRQRERVAAVGLDALAGRTRESTTAQRP